MNKLILAAAAAAALFGTAAVAAPLAPTPIGAETTANVTQVRLICDEYGRCVRTRGPRYVQRGYGYGDGYARRGYDDGRYYGRPSYYGGGPSIGFSFGGGRY